MLGLFREIRDLITTISATLTTFVSYVAGLRGTIEIPLTSCVLGSTGAPLAIFADGATATPGLQITNSEAVSIRWNNHATPTPVAVSVGIPADLDDTEDVIFKALVSKVGATIGDATTLTVAGYFQAVAAPHDADTDVGGASDAVVGDATSKTVSLLSRTIVAADVPAAPATLALFFGPTDGTLGTDDFCLHRVWAEYAKKTTTWA